jgi:transcriptional regulator with XRE-family HTH domain
MNTQGTRWRGQIPIPLHANPLIKRLIELANEQKTTMREVAERAGLRPETVSNWRYRNSPRIADFEAALNAIGYELKIVETREIPTHRIETVAA